MEIESFFLSPCFETITAIAAIITIVSGIIGFFKLCIMWGKHRKKLQSAKAAAAIFENAKSRPYRYEEIIIINRFK
jgi:hypothetical protein